MPIVGIHFRHTYKQTLYIAQFMIACPGHNHTQEELQQPQVRL